MFAFGQVIGGCYSKQVKMVLVIYQLHVDINDIERVIHVSYFLTDLRDSCLSHPCSSFHSLSSTF